MDIGLTILLTFLFGLIALLIQRSERRRRLLVFLSFLVVGELIRRYAFFRDAHTEVWVALVIALALNGLFWVFIGRYNPPGSSEEIDVIGLDD
jgi:peptidoglycan/LPS O-acetylase OafA/YrhL